MDPLPVWLRRLWDEWDNRMLILLSLSFQVILFIFGERRKYISSTWLRILVWLAYLVADWVTMLAIGKLSDAELDSGNTSDITVTLRLIWTPLLLLHLGGPDTITAYSSEDNQLWLRHLLGFVVQLSMAIYVFLMTWRISWFSFLTFPIFVAAIIKYGERIWALRSASKDQFLNLRLPLGAISPDSTEFDSESLMMAYQLYTMNMPHVPYYASLLETVHQVLRVLKPLLIEQDYLKCWEVMEIEMGMMFDLNYTKAPITYTKLGSILRFISFFCTLSALLGFFLVVFVAELQGHYSTIDIAITGVLLVGALCLEIYAIALVLSSDWARFWLIKHHKNQVVTWFLKTFPWFMSTQHKKKRWSNSMGQFNVHDLSLVHKPMMLRRILGWLGIEEMFNICMVKSSSEIPQNLRGKIMEFIMKNRDFVGENGGKVLQLHNCKEELKWITDELDFCGRVLLWHIATELCYQKDFGRNDSSDDDEDDMKACKLLSSYMVYLLVMCPFMLPRAKHVKLKQSITAFQTLFKEVEQTAGQITTMVEDPGNKEDYLITGGARLVQFLSTKEETKWKILASVWLEMLCYAADNCYQDTSIQLVQLRRGGELLTLIWLFLSQTRILYAGLIISTDRIQQASP